MSAAGMPIPPNNTGSCLRLASSQGFAALAWLWWLRDSGWFAELTWGQKAVLTMLFSHVNGQGVASPSQDTLARECGLKSERNRSVRDALCGLANVGLIAPVDRPRGSASRAQHYQLLRPDRPAAARDGAVAAHSPGNAPGHTAGKAPADAMPEACAERESRFPGNPGSHEPGSAVPTNREARFPQRVEKRDTKQQQGAHKASSGEPPPPGLFAGGPDYEAAAAAALRVWGGFARRPAHGLVSQYRPTRRQVLNVIANAFAWRRAHRRGQAQPLHNLQGFIRSELRRGSWSLDDRVLTERRNRQQRVKQRPNRVDADANRHYLAAQAELGRMSPADRKRLREHSLGAAAKAGADVAAAMESRVKHWMVLQLMRESE